MKFTIEKNVADKTVSFHGCFSESVLASLELDNFDRALLVDVGSDSNATAADQLLVLEMIYRRYAEQAATK